MTPNLRSFDRSVRLVLGATALFVAFAIFRHPVAIVLTAFVAIYFLGECVTGVCPLYRALGVQAEKDRLTREGTFFLALAAVQAALAYEWLYAGWLKLSSAGAFVANIGATLSHFASENPYPWYKDFLLGIVMQDAALFAYLVEWSQVVIAASLFLSMVLYLFASSEFWRRLALIWAAAALVGGLIQNANFYLAAGWTALGTRGVNVVMFWIQGALLYAWLYRLLIAKPSPVK